VIDPTLRRDNFAAWLTIAGLVAVAVCLRNSVPLFVTGLMGTASRSSRPSPVLKLYQSVAERWAYMASIDSGR
jgi:hypothetical protein